MSRIRKNVPETGTGRCPSVQDPTWQAGDSSGRSHSTMPGTCLVRALALLVLVPVLLLVGCSAKEAAHKVKGKVIYNNEPLTGGSVTFVSTADKLQRSTTLINADGTYEMPSAPVGEVKIAIIGPGRSSTEHAASGKRLTLPNNLPEKYRDADKSGLSYTVTSETTQEHNIELK